MKKILVRAPIGEENIIMSFPLMHALREEYNADKLTVILDEGEKNLYEALPFPVEIFEFPVKKNSIVGIHHFCANLHEVFNIDLYFDLQNTFKSAFMGISFRSQNRIAYKVGFNAPLINHKINKKEFEGIETDLKFLKLLNSYSGKSLDGIRVCGDKISLLKDTISPYILIFIPSIETINFLEELKKLINEFSDQNIVFVQEYKNFECCDDEKGKLQLLIKNLPTSNIYKIGKYENFEQLMQLIISSKVILTCVDWIGIFSSYLGEEAMILSHLEINTPTCKFFNSSPINVIFEKGQIRLKMDGGKKVVENIKFLGDFIHNFFEL